jgi:hypothetical protein
LFGGAALNSPNAEQGTARAVDAGGPQKENEMRDSEITRTADTVNTSQQAEALKLLGRLESILSPGPCTRPPLRMLRATLTAEIGLQYVRLGTAETSSPPTNGVSQWIAPSLNTCVATSLPPAAIAVLASRF